MDVRLEGFSNCDEKSELQCLFLQEMSSWCQFKGRAVGNLAALEFGQLPCICACVCQLVVMVVLWKTKDML